jgi:hypothetical protein
MRYLLLSIDQPHLVQLRACSMHTPARIHTYTQTYTQTHTYACINTGSSINHLLQLHPFVFACCTDQFKFQ